jgi:hypothetical protein
MRNSRYGNILKRRLYTEEDQAWADLLSPARRSFLVNAGLFAGGPDVYSQEKVSGGGPDLRPFVPQKSLAAPKTSS